MEATHGSRYVGFLIPKEKMGLMIYGSWVEIKPRLYLKED
jgi:hypothetical protein